MLNSNLEALPSQIRAKLLVYAVAAAQNDPQKPGTPDINFEGYWLLTQGECVVLNIKHNEIDLQLSTNISINQVRWTPRYIQMKRFNLVVSM